MTTTSKPEHTPTPWGIEISETSLGSCFKIGPFPSDGAYETTHACIYVDGTHPIDYQERRLTKNAAELEANAMLIVHRVNVHEQLVEALEAVKARRICWPKETEDLVNAALLAARGGK